MISNFFRRNYFKKYILRRGLGVGWLGSFVPFLIFGNQAVNNRPAAGNKPATIFDLHRLLYSPPHSTMHVLL